MKVSLNLLRKFTPVMPMPREPYPERLRRPGYLFLKKLMEDLDHREDINNRFRLRCAIENRLRYLINRDLIQDGRIFDIASWSRGWDVGLLIRYNGSIGDLPQYFRIVE